MTEIIFNKKLTEDIVKAIVKAVTEDVPKYLYEHSKETNNALGAYRGDCINDNLRNFVVSEDIQLLRFRRFGWQGRLLLDTKNKITYTITTQANLKVIPRKKDRTKPHFLQSILEIENGAYEVTQPTLFPLNDFSRDTLENDYNDIIAGIINPDEGYRHYVIAYDCNHSELLDVRMDFLDRNFNVISQMSLNEYIKPDFATLTSIEQTVNIHNETNPVTTRNLVSIKSGIRPHIKEVEKHG